MVGDMHGNFILRSSQRKPDAILSRHQRTARQQFENFRQFFAGQRAVAVIAFRQFFTLPV